MLLTKEERSALEAKRDAGTATTEELERLTRDDALRAQQDGTETDETDQGHAAPSAPPGVRAAQPAPVPAPVAAPAAPAVDAEAVRSEERTRIAGIRELAETAGFTVEQRDGLINSGASVDDARRVAVDALISRDAARSLPGGGVVSDARDIGVDSARAGCLSMLEHRCDPTLDVSEEGNEFRGMSLMEMGRALLAKRGISLSGMSRMNAASVILGLERSHGTSDFPLLLADAANKSLRRAYEENAQTWGPLARRTTASDFKAIKRLQLGDAPTLQEVPEGAEFKMGTIGEGKEEYSLLTYGRRFGVTRQALINDDLDAMNRFPSIFGSAVRDLESDLVYAQFSANPDMADGNPLFDAAHSNVGTGAISVASLGAARTALRKQTGVNGRRINVIGEYLVVPAAQETTAEQYIANNVVVNVQSNHNPFAGRLKLIVDPRLDDVSTTQWYLFANYGRIDTMEVATLEGENGPALDSRVGFEVDGVEFKVRHDFATKVIDWRGMYRSTGA